MANRVAGALMISSDLEECAGPRDPMIRSGRSAVAAGVVPALNAFLSLAALACAAGAYAQGSSEVAALAERQADADSSSFLFVPYPITEPAIGSGLLAGPVWMRDGPEGEAGPNKPQAFGAGVLWTDGGSRGVVAFDHRAWSGGDWRTTVAAADIDLVLSYPGLSPRMDRSLDFTLQARGAGIEGEKRLDGGPSSLSVRVFSAKAEVSFEEPLPVELAGDRSHATIAGLAIGWSRDTRDSVFTPSTGQVFSARLTAYPEAMGASFDAQSLAFDWIAYRSGPGKGALGIRSQLDLGFGDPPFYLRPYVSLRGVAALRYPGEQVGSVEAEYRWPVNARWDLLAFGGIGSARADIRGITATKTVSAAGAGVRFKVRKLFGLTFGLDFAHGPEGTVTYIQIGNAWSK